MEGKRWKFIGDKIIDISIGADGSIFVLGGQRSKNGWTLYQYRGKQGWKTYVGRVRRIAVDKNGRPWVISPQKKVYEWNGKTWKNRRGRGDEMAIGADGSVFVVR